MIRTKFDGVIRSMTVSVFASLPTVWPEYLDGHGGHGTLLARVHVNCNRRFEDGTTERDVIARGLVYMPEETIFNNNQSLPAHLSRLTIRYTDTELNYDYLKSFPDMQSFAVHRVEQYRRCVEQLKVLPVIDFWDLCRTWPVIL